MIADEWTTNKRLLPLNKNKLIKHKAVNSPRKSRTTEQTTLEIYYRARKTNKIINMIAEQGGVRFDGHKCVYF